MWRKSNDGYYEESYMENNFNFSLNLIRGPQRPRSSLAAERQTYVPNFFLFFTFILETNVEKKKRGIDDGNWRLTWSCKSF